MDLSIIIVNYNVKEFLENLLNSIVPATVGIETEIFVIDNASSDGSKDIIEQKFPHVKCVWNRENLGFAKANNIGLKMATGKNILLLNPDTILNENTLKVMISFMDNHAEVGMAGCKILNPDGTLQLACRRGFPGPWTSFCKVSGLSNLFPQSRLFARYNLTYRDENQSYEVDAISGSFMMIRKEVYDAIGGLDEDFFMYGEDLDLCYRVQKAGYKVYYVHETQIIHFKGESTKRSSVNDTANFYNAMRLFVRKHFAAYLFVEAILMLGIAVRYSMAFIWRKRLVFLTFVLDVIVFDYALYFAEQIIKHESHWNGFPEFAVPVIYTVPVLLHTGIGAIIGQFKKDTISVGLSLLASVCSFLMLTSLTYFFKEFGYSRAVVLLTYIIASLGFIVWRLIAKFKLKLDNPFRAGARRVLVVGASDSAKAIAERLLSKRTEYYQLMGFIASDMRDVGSKILGSTVVGSLENIDKVITELKVTEVIFSTGDLSYAKIMEVVSGLQKQGIEFKVAGSDMQFIIGKTEITMLEDIPLVEISYNLSRPAQKIIKRLFDIVMAMVLIPVLCILRFSSGPGRKKQVLQQWCRFLPSVLNGSMSIIGPKMVHSSALYLGKKGITGLWFIEFEGEQNLDKLDIFYAKNQNIWLDMEILSKSFIKILSGE